jgi:hypothetical protein
MGRNSGKSSMVIGEKLSIAFQGVAVEIGKGESER